MDSGNNRIVLVVSSAVVGVSGTSGAGLLQFNAPLNVSVGERGIYIADAGGNRIQCLDPLENGVYAFGPSDARFAFSDSFNQPSAIAAVDNLTNEMFYVADTGNNRVRFYAVPGEDPSPSWTNMVARVTAGDMSGAMPYFSSDSSQNYQQAFLSVGTAKAVSDINDIGPLTPVFIKNDTAEYYFEQTINGQLTLFPVEFIKENGSWKILEF